MKSDDARHQLKDRGHHTLTIKEKKNDDRKKAPFMPTASSFIVNHTICLNIFK